MNTRASKAFAYFLGLDPQERETLLEIMTEIVDEEPKMLRAMHEIYAADLDFARRKDFASINRVHQNHTNELKKLSARVRVAT